MQTGFAQILSLISYGNEFIKNGNIAGDFFPGASVFQHCNTVNFSVHQHSLFRKGEKVVANDPVEWFRLLKKQGCRHLRLYYRPMEKNNLGPAYNLAGFVGAESIWMIEANFESYSHYWQSKWEVTNKNAPDNKIWGVNYLSNQKKSYPSNQQGDIEESRKKLSDTLTDLMAFCTQQNLTWLDTFEKAYKAMHDAAPGQFYYHHDLVVAANYTLPAQQLLFAATTAWVFGGMGWWNDMGFADQLVQEKYLELSQLLYDQVLQAIIASINSF